MIKAHIKMFRTFMDQFGSATPFKGFYRDYRFPDNPESYEEYLEKVEPPFAIVTAFDFNKIKLNKTFDTKYWYKLHVLWNRRLVSEQKNIDRMTNDSECVNLERQTDTKKDEWFSNLLMLGDRSPKEMKQTQIRFRPKTNLIVFNEQLSKTLTDNGLDAMAAFVDPNTNQLVFLFSKQGPFNVRSYTNDKLCVQHRYLTTYLTKYIEKIENDDNYYFIKFSHIGFSTDKTKYAITIKQEFEKSNA